MWQKILPFFGVVAFFIAIVIGNTFGGLIAKFGLSPEITGKSNQNLYKDSQNQTSKQIEQAFSDILNIIIPSLKNVTINKVTKNEFIGLINIKGCSPNCKLEPEHQLSGGFTFVGLSMFDNSDKLVYTMGVMIKNGVVYSGAYNSRFVTPLSAANYIHDIYRNYLNNNYNSIGENIYDIKDRCTATLLFQQGNLEFSNSGQTNIIIKCN